MIMKYVVENWMAAANAVTKPYLSFGWWDNFLLFSFSPWILVLLAIVGGPFIAAMLLKWQVNCSQHLNVPLCSWMHWFLSLWCRIHFSTLLIHVWIRLWLSFRFLFILMAVIDAVFRKCTVDIMQSTGMLSW
jgi:hypothetical protein